DRATGQSRGFGFVELSTAAEAQTAISAWDGKDLEGRKLKVAVAEERPGGRGGGGGGGGGGGRGGGGGYGGGGGRGGGGRRARRRRRHVARGTRPRSRPGRPRRRCSGRR